MQVLYYTVKKAVGRRKSFAILEHRRVDGKVTTPTLDIPALNTINTLYAQGVIPFESALAQVNELKKQLHVELKKKNPKNVYNQDNLRTLNHYWKQVYGDRDLVDPDTMLGDLKRAIGSVGELSLAVATKEQLQKAINTKWELKPNKQRRVVTRLNSLLKFLNRDFQLRKMRRVPVKVTYLTWQELQAVLPHIEDPHFRTMVLVAFTTGARAGELFAITRNLVRDKYIQVETQIDNSLITREIKNRKPRNAFILPEGRGSIINDWLAISDEEKNVLRVKRHSTIFRKACKAAGVKSVSFHALRHSYAIHLLGKGAPLAQVAQSLGNSTKVCEDYYTGFVLTDMSIEVLEAVVRQQVS